MTLHTHGGEAWATMGYPLSIHRVNVMLVVAAHAQFRAGFETLSRARFRKTRVLRKALSALRSLVILVLGPQAS